MNELRCSFCRELLLRDRDLLFCPVCCRVMKAKSLVKKDGEEKID